MIQLKCESQITFDYGNRKVARAACRTDVEQSGSKVRDGNWCNSVYTFFSGG